MKSTALHHQSKDIGRSSSIYNKALSDPKTTTAQSLTTKNTPSHDSEKERIITIVHNSIVWFDWG
jgi:hypothetical protein